MAKQILSKGWTKLDSGIVDSTLWAESHETLRVWIALLAKCDAGGYARIAVPALSRLCSIDIEELEGILTALESPDPYSRNQDNEGRRIARVEGGFVVLSYENYRAMRTRAQTPAERKQAQRERELALSLVQQCHASHDSHDVTPEAEAEAEAEAEESISEASPLGDEESPEREDDELTPQQLRVRQVLDIYPRVKPGFAARWIKEWGTRLGDKGFEKLLTALRGMMDDGLATEGPDYVTKALRSALKNRAGEYKPKRGGDDFETRRRTAGAVPEEQATSFD